MKPEQSRLPENGRLSHTSESSIFFFVPPKRRFRSDPVIPLGPSTFPCIETRLLYTVGVETCRGVVCRSTQGFVYTLWSTDLDGFIQLS